MAKEGSGVEAMLRLVEEGAGEEAIVKFMRGTEEAGAALADGAAAEDVLTVCWTGRTTSVAGAGTGAGAASATTFET